MKSFILSFLGFILFFGSLLAQISSSDLEQFDSTYGKDPALYRGVKYSILHKVDFGSPFLYSNESMPGRLTYNGNVYKEVKLSYDLFEQQLLLTYRNHLGAINQLVLLTASVDSFSLGKAIFKRNFYSDLSVPFIRFFGDEKGIQCIATYEKDYGFSSKTGESGFGYSQLMMKKYLLVNDRPLRILRNNQFVKYLPDSKTRERCKTYLKKMKWNIRKMDDVQFNNLCNYLNNSANE